VLAGIITFTDKVIDEDTANDIRRAIGMTKIGMIIEREKEEAAKREKEKALRERERKFAVEMLRDRELSLDKIARYSGLDITAVTELAKGI
jgi:predicted HTH domain antitoxin